MINDDLGLRLNYHGGSGQQDRMIRDKLWSLKMALKGPSYHRATAVLSDGREFYCLMNPSKLNLDIDYKEISIPFEDICLNKERQGKTTEGIEKIGMQCGDIFTWKETKTDWLVYVQRVDELAYFRAGCYKCNVEVQFGDFTQEGHIIGPSVRNVDWRQYVNAFWNNINYDAVLLLPKTEEVMENLKRFNKLFINEKQWEVQARNMFTEGVIEIAIKEDFTNTTAYAQRDLEVQPIDYSGAYITGQDDVDCFEKYTYYIQGASDGVWSITDSKLAKIITSNSESVTLGIISRKAGNFDLVYTYGNDETTSLNITIRSI